EKITMAKGKIIAITNEKGGVGKSTTATAVATVASQLFNKRVLIIDVDQQGNTSKNNSSSEQNKLINFRNYLQEWNPEKISQGETISDVLMRKASIEEIIVKTKYENLDLIKADIQLNIAKQYITASANHLKSIINPLLEKYDLIIYDTPPATDNMLTNVLNSANECYIPITPEKQAIDGMLITAYFINQQRKLDNPELNYKVFFNKVDYRIKAHKQTIEDIYAVDTNRENAILSEIPGNHMMQTIIRNQADIVDNENSYDDIHFTLIEGHRRSKIADEYVALTREILGGEGNV
ncbi:MAG: ParA family protein, partial [Coprobacillaceae bacterium]